MHKRNQPYEMAGTIIFIASFFLDAIIDGCGGLMRKLALVLLSVCALFWASEARAQDDTPSLGDVARQARQQKQQKEAQTPKQAQTSLTATDGAPAADAANTQSPKAPKKVITNEELPEHIVSAAARTTDSGQASGTSSQKSGEQGDAEQTKSRIQQMKSDIASMQSQIADLEQSVHYAGGNCVSGCVQWNENQQKKQEQAATMKQQLEQMQQSLEQAQESARKQGYGSSVSDPD
jgi:hypothetical protein